MEKQEAEQSVISPNSDRGSLQEFKQTVLGVDNELDSSFSTVAPDSSLILSVYTEDQFEGVFYNTVREESQITVSFVSKVFYNTFENKFMSNFANTVGNDASQCSFKCTTHVKSLRCDLKLDGKSRIVTISGVGRIVWRKDYFPKIARAKFKQYVQLSDTENHSGGK